MDRPADITRHTQIDASGANTSQSWKILARDKTQSHLLHEFGHIRSHTDPMTGNDVMGSKDHPFVVDGMLTVYFESEKTRQDYLNMLFNHPEPSLAGRSLPEDYRGG